MQHRPFPKIPTALADTGTVGALWVATEKIHGAQLVVATDGRIVRVGKRKAWLEPEDAFFGWQMVRGELESKVRRMFAALGLGRYLYLYGELFGGSYPHPDVAALPGLSAVQTGIWYAPGLAWVAFDALVIGDDAPVFLAHDHLERLTAEVELSVPPRLGRGSRNELSRLPIRYASRVPAMFGLPEISGNVAEGFVLKPDVELPAALRPLVKHKIPEFDDKLFDASRPFDADAYLSVVELLQLAESMICPMRVASARSKVGDDVSAVVQEMVLDVWIDLEEMFSRRMGGLTESETEQLRVGLTAMVEAVHR